MSDKTELDALVKLTEEFVTATWHLLDNSETSGPKDDPTITVWQPNFDEVSALLDRCEGLPNGSMEHMAAGELLAANLISAITTLRAHLAVAEACNRGLVRLNEATQDRADRAEIKLAKAVEALEEISEYDTGATAGLAYTAKHHLAEIKGASHD